MDQEIQIYRMKMKMNCQKALKKIFWRTTSNQSPKHLKLDISVQNIFKHQYSKRAKENQYQLEY